jgi:23S rRNA (uracil1939-C5)-methyltransferase
MTPCCHFTICGGCISQDVPSTDYLNAKREAVVSTLARAGLANVTVEAVMPVSPRSRRRAVFKIARNAQGIEIGFHAAKSHVIVDMRECLVLSQGLFDLVQQLRIRLLPVFHEGEHAELHVIECDNGFDCALRWKRKPLPDLVTAMAGAVKGLGIVRLILNTDVLLEIAAPVIRFGEIAVTLPPHAFLQPTREGEAMLAARVLAITANAKNVADLFSGCGTFSLALAARARVHAVEQDRAMLEALAAGARKGRGLKPVTTEIRDLFKQPLMPQELNGYDAVTLDPPRAGAEAQARALAASKQLRRLAYVACDAASFARDAAILVDGGFTLGAVTLVDQFLWSSHIELVGEFFRGKA